MGYEAKPDKRLLALILIVVTVLPLLVVVELAVPGVQPEFQAAPPSGVTTSSPGTSAVAGIKVVIPDGTSLNHALNFSPNDITLVIGVNNSVTWVNDDSTEHTATFTSGPAGANLASISGDIQPGTSFGPVTFSVPGTYAYHCQFHPGWMRGTIIVLAAKT